MLTDEELLAAIYADPANVLANELAQRVDHLLDLTGFRTLYELRLHVEELKENE